MILVLGTDPLHSSPILDLRVRKAIRRNGARLVVATERPTALDGGAEAIARYAPGEAAHFIGELTKAIGGERQRWRRRWPRACATPARSSSSGASGSTATAAGADDRAARAGRERSSIAGTDGAGLLEVPDVTNARGLREAGVLPDAGPGLAARRPPATAPSRSARRSSDGDLDRPRPLRRRPAPRLPRHRRLGGGDHRRRLRRLLLDASTTATAAKADVVFPLETHAEKDGTVTHPDGRLQRVRPAAGRPGDIRPGFADPRRAVHGPRPRHRRRLPAHRLRGSDQSGPLLRRRSPTRRSAAAASAGRRPSQPASLPQLAAARPRAPLARNVREARPGSEPQ